MPIFTVSVSFDSSERVWKVCRARTVIEKHATRMEAVHAACRIAVALRRHMYCDMSFRLQDRRGGWHAYAFVNDDRPAAAIATRLLCKYPGFVLTDFLRSLPIWHLCIHPFIERGMRLFLHRLERPRLSL